MGRLRRPALAATLLAGLAAPATAQVSDYEMRYGQVVEVSVDDLLSMPESYVEKAVRTRGELDMALSGTQITYVLRGTFGGRLYLYPTAEAGVDWEHSARQWAGKEIEVTGAVGMGKDEGGQRITYLLVWGYLGPTEDKPGRRPASAQVTLEVLVT